MCVYNSDIPSCQDLVVRYSIAEFHQYCRLLFSWVTSLTFSVLQCAAEERQQHFDALTRYRQDVSDCESRVTSLTCFVLQRAAEERQQHVDALTRYRQDVSDYESWLAQARVDASVDAMVSLDTTYLKEQKRENKVGR